ncbi:MAG TPA: MBL fold metallo-hydrolase [Pseudonocardiaceae bacterium]|jgi:glyoxylase-like metal-dependent hydrolase (beta-lactamase superfamily II)|nr:MBL fold metallo-hydrolase [Pseudonocardiaceae bacterium]
MAASPANGSGTAITVLGTEQHLAWQQRTLPPVERISGGLWSVPVPIPDNPLRYTLSYLVPGDNGVVVVDPGWQTDEGWQALLAGLTAAGVSVSDVVGVVATHIHPDHHGLSARLRAESGAWVAMHPLERDTLPHRVAAKTAEGRRDAMARMLLSSGAPPTEVTGQRKQVDPGANRPIEMAEPDVLLDDGDLVPLPGRRLRAIWTPGHTPGHLCLQEPDARLLLTGDHVLPRITPNIGMQPGLTNSPLRRFIESLERVGEFDDHDALPAHEYRFRGLAVRTRQLIEHHDHRCRELVDVVTELGTPTLWQLAENLTWSRPWAEVGAMRFAALAETAAHVSHLVDLGQVAWQIPDSAAGEDRQPARLRRVADAPVLVHGAR